MNFDFGNVKLFLTTKEEILAKISYYDIWLRYCSKFKEIGKAFSSELRLDKNPSCSIYINNNNELRYKDFVTGDNLSCWEYIMKKYNCNYYESLNIVTNDFKIKELSVDISPNVIIGIENKPIIQYKKEKTIIEIKEQFWNITDYNYWKQYEISFDLLNEYNVFSCKYVYLYKGNKRIIFEYKKSNPIYAYRFIERNEYSYKIYFPLEQKGRKFLFNGTSDNIEGFDQLNLYGEILILTKSLKDVMCYKTLGYNAISLQGEANKLKQDVVDKLLKRFNKVIINYDNDNQGIISTNKLINQYKFDHFYIDEYKDLSDYIKYKSLNDSRIMINNKINGI